MAKTRWYKDAVIYQIYPRSFCDTNGDGIGDLRGIIQKLDYIKSLGVNCVWLCPCYKSPNVDNGYDISDYRNIMDEFGTMEDWEEMAAGFHARGIKIVMDLVVNHTSDKHEWFQRSRSAKDDPYRDYYIWRKGRGKNGKKPPNNWTSRFLGPAWTYDEKTKEFYLHLFSKEQPDLNWDNPKVRQEIADICNYWFDKGVDGFRCDVITYISKEEGLPNGKFNIALVGDEHFVLGPHYHEYIKELNQRSWSKYDSMIVGEGQGVGIEQAEELMSEDRQELDSVFTFEQQTKVDTFFETFPKKFNLKKWKEIFSAWQQLPDTCWNSVFLENHDYPRTLPRYGKIEYREKVAKMLCLSVYFLRGTAYVYQGQEIGMTNIEDFRADKFKDIIARAIYEKIKRTAPFMLPFVNWAFSKKGRDHARTPMQWNAETNAGFSTGKPWIQVNANYKEINVETEEGQPDGILNFYRKILKFRVGNKIIRYGSYELFYPDDKKLWVYKREYNGMKYLVVANYTDKKAFFIVPDKLKNISGKTIFSNYEDSVQTMCDVKLRPYEALVFQINENR